jgi:hypothetical protein
MLLAKVDSEQWKDKQNKFGMLEEGSGQVLYNKFLYY